MEEIESNSRHNQPKRKIPCTSERSCRKKGKTRNTSAIPRVVRANTLQRSNTGLPVKTNANDVRLTKTCIPPQEFKCTICLDTQNSRHTEASRCGHIFHTSCLRKWLKLSNSCPICRTSIVMETTPASRRQNTRLNTNWRPIARFRISIPEQTTGANVRYFTISSTTPGGGTTNFSLTPGSLVWSRFHNIGSVAYRYDVTGNFSNILFNHTRI